MSEQDDANAARAVLLGGVIAVMAALSLWGLLAAAFTFGAALFFIGLLGTRE